MTDNSNDIYEGACACGSVKYRMTSKPIIVHCCHCSWCQRETGSAFVLNAMIESDRVETLSGEVEMTHIPSESGKGQDIMRCTKCQIALWSHYSGLAGIISSVRIGTLNEPVRLQPDVHIFTSTKLPWVVLPEDVPSFAEYYDRKELWPAESLARSNAVFAKMQA